MTMPFRPYHHFTHWCPLAATATFCSASRAKTPALSHSPQDYWHEPPSSSTRFGPPNSPSRPARRPRRMEPRRRPRQHRLLGADGRGRPGRGPQERGRGSASASRTGSAASSPTTRSSARAGDARAAKRSLAPRGRRSSPAGPNSTSTTPICAPSAATEKACRIRTIVGLNEKAAVLHYQKKAGQDPPWARLS